MPWDDFETEDRRRLRELKASLTAHPHIYPLLEELTEIAEHMEQRLRALEKGHEEID